MKTFRISGLRPAVFLVVLCASPLVGSLQAQDQREGSSLLALTPSNPLTELQERMSAQSVSNSLLAMEGALASEEYILGPGDMLTITVGGIMAINHTVAVSVSGDLALPDVGIIPAAGRSLADVREDAIERLRVQYANVPIELYLIQPRMFYVHISGAVPEPGRYLMMPISRVDDVIHQAFASRFVEAGPPGSNVAPRFVSLVAPEHSEISSDYRPSLRNVRVKHRDGTDRSIDLMHYYTTGDTEHNPYLQDGDVVVVPAYHFRRDGVRVSGEIAYPGTHDLRPGDTILEHLALAAGPDGLDDIHEVRLTRKDNTGQAERIIDINVRDVIAGNAPAVPVEKGDYIHVQVQMVATAVIQGRVTYPGTYRIEDASTTLRELIDMAGDLRDDANLAGAFLERRNPLDFYEMDQEDDRDFFSRDLVPSSAKQELTRVIVDIEKALASDSDSDRIMLYDGDRVVVPRDEHMVHVYGHVQNPGYVPLEAGRTAGYYIGRVGGKGTGSRSVYVFDIRTGDVRTGEHQQVRTGDTIFVDRRLGVHSLQLGDPERVHAGDTIFIDGKDVTESPEIAQLLLTERQNRRQTRIMTTQAIVAGVTAITGIVTVVVAILNFR